MCEIQNGDWNGGSGGRQDCGGNVNSFPSSQGYYEIHLKIKGSWRHRMTTTVRLMRKMKHELKTSLFRIGAVRLTSILRFKALSPHTGFLVWCWALQALMDSSGLPAFGVCFCGLQWGKIQGEFWKTDLVFFFLNHYSSGFCLLFNFLCIPIALSSLKIKSSYSQTLEPKLEWPFVHTLLPVSTFAHRGMFCSLRSLFGSQMTSSAICSRRVSTSIQPPLT